MPESAPVEPGDKLATAIRAHVAALNRRFLSLAAGFDAIDAEMTAAINEHLAEIGLEDLEPDRK